MTRHRVGLAVAALVLLSGCGGDDSDVARPTASPSSPSSSSPSPSTEPSGRVPFRFDVAIRQVDPRQLVIRYGESSSCPYEQVDAEVQESAAKVVVTLTARIQATGRACTADYAARDVTLTLEQELGDRRVVDGSTGTEMTVATGEPPGPPGSPVPLPSD